MKKILLFIICVVIIITQNGCATIYGGQISECQRHIPRQGEPKRSLRPVAFTADVLVGIFLFEVPLAVDFITCAIFKPCELISDKQKTVDIKAEPKESLKATETSKEADKMVFTPAQGTLRYLDYKYGFRNLKFETPIDSIKNVIVIGDTIKGNKASKNMTYCKISDEVLSIGDYDLKSVIYGFYKNKLDYVRIDTKGLINSRGVLEVLKKLYGNGDKPNEYIEEYLWSGAKVSLMYSENTINNNATIVFFCKKLDRQQEKDEYEMQKKAIKDF